MPLDAFPVALAVVLKNEGGWADHASDRGSATNRGITLATLSAWRVKQKKPPASKDDVKALTLEETSAIYRALYWDAIRGDQLSSTSIATALFDTAVLNGTGTAAKAAQVICNTLGAPGTPLVVDGAIGPKTVAAINACDTKAFVLRLIDVLMTRYVAIVSNDATQRIWLSGWSRRASQLTGLAAI